MRDSGGVENGWRARHRTGRLARVLLGLGWALFAVMQVLPLFDDTHSIRGTRTDWGYQLWLEIFKMLRYPASLEARDGISLSGYLLAMLCVLVAPFAVKLLQSSRLLWWMFFMAMGISTLAFSVLTASSLMNAVVLDDGFRIRLGTLALLTFPYFSLAGLLVLRGRRPKSTQEPSESL
ncbi:hypothetical protein HNR46_000831 [Haloferula luteola]|uniref:EXPERA domain-containing protein n=1 Tax=Haloferula luteola TaxID=595692 RepID=A0A840V010_9BACT|nr:hypothetical protein [Haloferula luteola]MBB5350603.1 hypothetical protein [Haloferula luteola]